jgi:hypothetical protein
MPNWDEGFWDSGTWDSPASSSLLPLSNKKFNRRTMASNPTPDDDSVALALTEDLADGCHLLEVTLGIKQNTEAVMRAALDAASAARLAYPAAVQLVRDKTALHVTADEAGSTVILNCRLRLVKLFGTQYNNLWGSAGFPNQSTAVPVTMDQRFTLLNALRLYFNANPASESEDMEATSDICTTAHTALSNARIALNAAETAETEALKARAAGMKALRKRIRGLISELGQLMPEDDSRYETFGLNIPANPSPPLGIADLTLTTPAPKKIHAAWTYATRMTGTRLRTKRQGIDTDWVNAGTADGLEKTLEGFTAGQVVEVQVIPYNDGGDGPGSPVRTVVVA